MPMPKRRGTTSRKPRSSTTKTRARRRVRPTVNPKAKIKKTPGRIQRKQMHVQGGPVLPNPGSLLVGLGRMLVARGRPSPRVSRVADPRRYTLAAGVASDTATTIDATRDAWQRKQRRARRGAARTTARRVRDRRMLLGARTNRSPR